jgi:ankyrin repeat protein
MGKKGKRNKHKKSDNYNVNSDPFTAMVQHMMQEGLNESYSSLHALADLPLQAQKERVRAILTDIGTDCIQNDNDPMGDGDQSMILSKKKRAQARELFSLGGDINGYFEQSGFSSFALSCIVGNAENVKTTLLDITKRIQRPWSCNEEIKALLEKRETSMRLSPLLLIVSAGKNYHGVPQKDHVKIAKTLLKHGASPCAKDVLGKTVCHYGAGMASTPMTLEIVDMCIRAAQTAHLYGKDVELHNLVSATNLNGLRGVAGGFDTETGRRSVYVPTINKEVSVKPVNIRLLPPNKAPSEITMLADVQDRLGSVALHEVIMSNKVDAAQLLIRQHHCSVHVEDLDGISPMKMLPTGGMNAGEVVHMVTTAGRKEGAVNRKAKKHNENCCASCQKELSKDEQLTCSGCNAIVYCSPECQLLHWKQGHKRECAEIAKLSAGIMVDPAPPDGRFHQYFSAKAVSKASKEGSYRKPRGVKVNEKFVIKVQAGSDSMPLLIYDETRTCQFEINSGQPGFNEILTETRKEMTWDGRKTFMKASFDESGKCIIYPATAGVKLKYSW